MLWALVSSAYVIYLYRKLKGGAEPSPAASAGQLADLGATLDTVDRRLAALEVQLAGREKESVR